MSEDAMPFRPVPARSGHPLIWIAAAAAAAALAIAACLTWLLSRPPPPGESAWSRLPPGTTWAAELRGVAGLLGRGLDDAGVRFLLRRGAEELDAAARPDVGTDGATETFAARLEHGMVLYGVLSGAVAVVAPDNLVLARAGQGVFAIFRPPVGATAFIGRYPDSTYFNSIGAFLALHDGWLVAAENNAQIDDIIQNWDSNSLPLGPAPEGPAEGITLAVAGEMRNDGGPPARPPQQIHPLAPLPPHQQQPQQPGGMLAFRDPFASNPASEAAPAGPAFVMTVVPAPKGWEISGRAGEWPGSPGGTEEFAAELPEGRLPAGSDVAVAAAFSDSAREALLGRILDFTDLPAAPPRASPLRDWLRGSLLARVGNRVTLLAGEAAAPGNGYAPIPALALGWTWNSPPPEGEFARGLTAGLTALLAPDGSALANFLQAAVRWREAATPLGTAIVVTLPAPFVNGAEPTLLAGTDGMGWLGGGPEALPGESGAGGQLLAAVPQPAAGEIIFHANWRTTGAFRAGTAAFLAERWRAVPARRRAEFPALPRAARWAEWFSAAYPNGRLTARARAAERAALWRAVVRRGESVK